MLKNKKKGFSLVELIVIIAILAIFAAIITPSLMQYTENSRAQKDESAMDEVVNAVQLALADEQCFDEMLAYSCTNNYLTYSDSSGNYGQQINDGEFWAPDGLGRATTITFNPEVAEDGTVFWAMDTAIVNDMAYGNGSNGEDRTMEGNQLTNAQCYLKNTHINGGTSAAFLYNSVRQSVGDKITADSATYKNSSFTVFIKFSQKDGVTVADVYGQFNGTNLYDDAPTSIGSGTSDYDANNNPITSLGGGTTTNQFNSSDFSGTGGFGITIDYKKEIDLNKLEKGQSFGYYSSLLIAANDINSNSVGKNADKTKDDANVGVFVDYNGYNTVVILNDIDSHDAIKFTKNALLNLNGHKISLTGANRHYVGAENCTLTIDGTINGSEIFSETDYAVVATNARLIINGGKYELNHKGEANQPCIRLTLDAKISNAEIIAKGDNAVVWGIYTGSSDARGECLVENCTITAETNSTTKGAYGMYAGHEKTTINGSTIIGSSRSPLYEQSYGVFQLVSCETLILNGCNIHGDRVGVSIRNAAYVNGGKYTSKRYGAFYVSSTNNPVYIENATLQKIHTGDIGEGTYGAALYMGGGADINDVHVYLNNCKIKAPNNGHAIVIKTDVGNKNNNVYLSNVEFTEQGWIRMDTEEAHVFIGKNCDITENDAQIPSNVVITDKEYKRP